MFQYQTVCFRFTWEVIHFLKAWKKQLPPFQFFSTYSSIRMKTFKCKKHIHRMRKWILSIKSMIFQYLMEGFSSFGEIAAHHFISWQNCRCQAFRFKGFLCPQDMISHVWQFRWLKCSLNYALNLVLMSCWYYLISGFHYKLNAHIRRAQESGVSSFMLGGSCMYSSWRIIYELPPYNLGGIFQLSMDWKRQIPES